MQITIFKNILSTSAGFDRHVSLAVKRIKEGNSKKTVTIIRSEQDKEKRNALKKTLPSICFSGTFKNRSQSGLKNHSGLICIDFDKFPNREELQVLRDSLEADEHTMILFESPSGNGLKCVVKVPAEPENHKGYFASLKDYYSCEYFDISTSDIPRVCYESYDPEIYVNYDSVLFTSLSLPELEDLGERNIIIPETSNYVIIENLKIWWERRYGFVANHRNENLIKLAFAFNDFGIDKHDAESFFSQFVSSSFQQSEVDTILRSGYSKQENFGTKQFENKAKRQAIQKDIINGKNSKQIASKHKDVPDIEASIDLIKDTLSTDEFWEIDKNGKYHLVHHKFKAYLESNQIYKYYPNESSFVFVKIEENKVSILKEEQIKDFVLCDLHTRDHIGFQPYDLMAGATRYFKSDYLSFLDNIELNLKQDTDKYCYLYYANCVLEVSANKVNTIEYLDLDGYVWDNQIIKRDFEVKDYKDGMYRKFIWLVGNKDESRYNTIKSVLGYLMHSYKTSANNKAIVFNDEVISENPNGGSGKGLIVQGLGKVKKVGVLDGKQFDFDKSFTYQTVDIDTQVLVYDDVKKKFDFERLFSVITEGITIERKNKDATRLRIDQSPKVLITTNYTIGGIGGSFERRKFEIELSSYFGSHHTPLDEFNLMLFDDWDKNEWVLFENFMIECVQYYLTNGLSQTEYTNLHTRKFIKETYFEFYEWVNDDSIKLNEKVYNKYCFDLFVEEYPDFKRWLTNKKFSLWIEAYAKFNNYELIKGKDGSGRYFTIKSSEEKSEKIPF
jgi:hypothetical protein